jgi:hypothetical protein
MKYVVLCNTFRRYRNEDRTHLQTHTMLVCVNKRDAEKVQEALSNADWQEQRDGDGYVQRRYEVAVQLYAGTVKRQKITLSQSDLEMIACEFTAPLDVAAE